MLRSCVLSLCRHSKGKVSYKVCSERAANQNAGFLRTALTSSGGSTFKAPFPASNTTFTSTFSSDATDSTLFIEKDAMNTDSDDTLGRGEFSEEEVIQQKRTKWIFEQT